MMEKKLIKKGMFVSFLFVFIFLSLSFVSAVKPESTAGLTGIILHVNEPEFIEAGESFQLSIHAFNETNDMPLVNGNNLTCYIHIYGTDGHHLFKGETSTLSDMFDYEIEISGTNFTEERIFPYIAQCNNTAANIGGFYGDSLSVTYSGHSDEKISPATIIFLLVILAYILIAVGIKGEEFVPIVFGAFILFGTSLYTYQNGIGSFANDSLPILIFTLVNVGLACYVSLKGIYEFLINGQ